MIYCLTHIILNNFYSHLSSSGKHEVVSVGIYNNGMPLWGTNIANFCSVGDASSQRLCSNSYQFIWCVKLDFTLDLNLCMCIKFDIQYSRYFVVIYMYSSSYNQHSPAHEFSSYNQFGLCLCVLCHGFFVYKIHGCVNLFRRSSTTVFISRVSWYTFSK